ncbi:hypothetical protein AB6E53_02355 [Vibrio breoganii]|uniref:Uncharacterized protein n=1 Tax=Vibrio breoganii TaxID=553239 RepID=A0AAP8MVI7_9VIBR|nr:hypothetical protein [Vibrio breoganii]PMP10229.1 hypothetical protein BCS93_11175 [Vibrio breoganii]
MRIRHKPLSEMDAQEYLNFLRQQYTELSNTLRNDQSLTREEMDSISKRMANLSDQMDRHENANDY